METKIKALCEQIDELARENAFLKVDLKLATGAAPTAPHGLLQRLEICEYMLGISRETEIPALEAESQRYDFPDGSRTNSCEMARLQWREHCYETKEKMVSHIDKWEGFVDVGFLNLVRKLTPSVEVPTQKAQVVNAKPGQTGAEVMDDMVQQAQMAQETEDARALAAADSAASEMNENHE